MFRQSICRLLAIALAAGLFGKVNAQINRLAPPGMPGAQGAAAAVDHLGETPECSCDCCQVTPRAQSQQVGGHSMSCALMALQPDGDAENACPATCVSSDPTLAVIVSADGSVQSERFCHMTCLPEQDKIGSTCRTVTLEEQQALLTQGGNGRDPAAMLAPVTAAPPAELVDPDAPPEPPQLADAQAMNDADDAAAGKAAADAEKGIVKPDEKKEKETGALVAEASGKQALAASMEARLTEAEASSAQSLSLANHDMEAGKSQALMVNAAKQQVQAAEVRANIYARSAAKAAARAQAELKEIQDIPRRAAEAAAIEAKRIVQNEVNEAASNVAIVKARLAGPGLPVPLAEAAVRAAQPYYAVMNKAIAMGNLYEANAHTLQDAAQTLQEQSRTVASQAVSYQLAGHGDMASKLMSQAKGMLAEAQTKDAQAQKDYAVAEGVRKQVPNYQANAAAASARATSLANPAGQPPAAIAPGFLQLSSRTKFEDIASH